MPSTEKPSTKYAIGVAIAATAGVIGYLGQRWLIPAFEWVMRLLGTFWHWLFTTHAVYGWLIILLAACAVCAAAVLIVLSLITRAKAMPQQPTEDDFNSFHFEGILWRWNTRIDGAIIDLCSFCPQPGCAMQIIPKQDGWDLRTYAVKYRCERCGYNAQIHGVNHNITSRITREIQRLKDTGEWKQHVKT